ncbi:MAG: 3-hydroxyacyl-CoA dehydrogenase family protein [Syntrophales bacterium]|nr:3-hydroxyacyl-CoA dehydrogenase family protein [Syntrophales bacterium]
MDNVLVIGAGYMGEGITQVVAQAGYKVYLQDVNPKALEHALAQIKWSTDKLAGKGKIKESAKAVQDRIIPVKDLSIAPKCQWVIEVVYDDEKMKKELFQSLDAVCPVETILASNTGTIPISRLGLLSKHPERIVGLHFFGPVPMMRLVEVIKADKTSDAVFNKTVEFAYSIDKDPVKVMRDIPAFALNRVYGSAIHEALRLVEEGIASPEDIDKGMRLGFGWNIGPFEIADNSGLDSHMRGGQALEAVGAGNISGNSKLMEKMVAAGRLGRKVGKGFYDYTPDGKKTPFDVTTLK